MDYAEEIEELPIWFALIDWWEAKQDIRKRGGNPNSTPPQGKANNRGRLFKCHELMLCLTLYKCNTSSLNIKNRNHHFGFITNRMNGLLKGS